MAWSQPSSKSHRLLFWSLAVLAVVMVLVVAFALRRFNGEMNGKYTSGNFVPLTQDDIVIVKDKSAVTGNVGVVVDDTGRTVVTGMVTEMLTRSKEEDLQWLVLSVSEEGDVAKKYLFSTDSHTEMNKKIVAGDRITVHFFGDPSESDAVVVGSVTNPAP